MSSSESRSTITSRESPRPRRRHARALLRYTLFQIPELALIAAGLFLAVDQAWLTKGSALVLLTAWLLKDVALFWIVRDAYAPGDGRLPRDPRGQVGIAPDGLDGEGYVQLGPERWRSRRAPTSGPIPSGSAVRVVALDGLTLEVEACPAPTAPEDTGRRSP